MKKKLTNILSITFATLLLTTPFSLPLTTITAEDTLTANSFTMQNGAALRLVEGSNGMRFSAEISQEEYTTLTNAGAKFGMLIVAKDLLKGIEITPETVFGENSSFYFTNKTEGRVNGKIEMINVTSPSCRNIDDDANIEICGSIANIILNNFTRSFIGRAYVAIPNKNAETGATTYEYHFAPYYDNNVANNTRCVYYIAQRSIEENEFVDELNKLYINPFASTDRFTKYHYAYKIQHHYIEHDDTLEGTGDQLHKIIYTYEETLYAQLNSTVLAHPIQKPTFDNKTLAQLKELDDEQLKAYQLDREFLSSPFAEKFFNHHYIYEVDNDHIFREGLVYAAGMQTFHLYYEASSTISEEHKRRTLDELLQHFLDVKNVEAHFGVELEENDGNWSAKQIFHEDNAGQHTGIQLHTKNPIKGEELLLTKEFFEELRAYGVEAITFTFTTGAETNKKVAYNVLQEELEEGDPNLYVTVYPEGGIKGTTDPIGNSGNSTVKDNRIKIYLEDITPKGGLVIRLHQSSSSNEGNYIFEDVVFDLYHDAQNL